MQRYGRASVLLRVSTLLVSWATATLVACGDDDGPPSPYTLATPALFDTRDMDDWRWGKLHRLTLGSLAPSAELDVPPATDPVFPGGFPRHGDVHSVDASSPGVRDLDFTYNHGPSMRHLVEIEPGKAPVSRFALPGGQVLSVRSIHFRDLVDRFWRTNEYFTLPWTVAEVLEKAEERWLLRP